MAKAFCCVGMKAMIEKDWVEHNLMPDQNPGKNLRYFVVHIDQIGSSGIGKVGLVLEYCFVCGEKIGLGIEGEK